MWVQRTGNLQPFSVIKHLKLYFVRFSLRHRLKVMENVHLSLSRDGRAICYSAMPPQLLLAPLDLDMAGAGGRFFGGF